MNQPVRNWILSLATTLCLIVPTIEARASLVSFGPGVYGSDPLVLNANVGLSGAEFEDFEDGTFLPGLSVFLSDVSTAGQIRTAPAEAWDGTRLYSNAIADLQDDGHNFRIEIDGGSTFVGIGISDLQGPAELRVNGTQIAGDILSLPNMVGGAQRNGYLVIRTENQELITSVEINELDDLHNDLIMIDHIAVPEPATFFLIAMGGITLLRRSRGQRASGQPA